MSRDRIIAIASVIVAAAVAIWFQFAGMPKPKPPTPPDFTAAGAPEPVLPQVHLSAAQEHARLMKLLHLSSLRPGVSADPRATNAANTDEAKANPYPDLPDPLRLKDGTLVSSRDSWWRDRRQEIADTLEDEVYGHALPASGACRLAEKADEQIGTIAVHTSHYITTIHSPRPPISAVIKLAVWLPASASGPVPVVLLLSSPKADAHRSTWREQVLAKGWGAALLDVDSVQADNAEGLTSGVIGFVSRGQPPFLLQWGVLRAWAWGASRAIDCLGDNPKVDPDHIAIAGHARYGKAALVAMAYDPRPVAAYISSSGAGGAALLRRHFGEQIENLASVGEFHLFGGNLLKYAGKLTPKDLPVDAHFLFAMAAPRAVFVSAGAHDDWVDPKGMFMAEAAATPVYKLLGKTGLAATAMPPAGTMVDGGGELAFRQHDQGDTMEPNWPYFLTFAQRFMTPAPKM